MMLWILILRWFTYVFPTSSTQIQMRFRRPNTAPYILPSTSPLTPTCAHKTETGRDAGPTSGISNHGGSDHAVSHCSFWFQLWDFSPVYIWNKTVCVWCKTQRGHFSRPFNPTCSSMARARPPSIWDRLLSAKLAWFELPHNIYTEWMNIYI